MKFLIKVTVHSTEDAKKVIEEFQYLERFGEVLNLEIEIVLPDRRQ